MKISRRITWIIFFILIAVTASKRLDAQTISDSILMSAMRDELNRNINDLDSASDMDKPFFIAYTIANARNYFVSASLGSLNRSQGRQYKDWNVRLMVGDYKINDENFNSIQPPDAIFRPSIDMPIEDDYLGIRRSLWLTTNNVYYAAARSYKNKMSLIENKQIEESDLEIEDFSRSPVVKKRLYASEEEIATEKIENTARELSALFKDQPDIFSSSVKIKVFQSTVYFINSEGTEVQFPMNITTLSVQAGSMTEDSDKLSKTLNYVASSPEKLPDLVDLESDISVMVDNLLNLRNTPRFEDDYYGPVMVVGEVAAETLENFLFAGSDGLIAFRETLQSGSQQSVYYERNSNSLQTKIGKTVISDDLTVTAEPFLTEYNGVPLLGSFNIDAEGVIPQEKLVLIENGVLKTLLNGRTPSREVPASNGHTRLDYSNMGLNKQVGPGVIRFKASNTISLDDMKQELIAFAKEQKQEYAMMIKSLETGGFDKPFNFYLIDVNTGEEKLTRSVRLSNLTLQSLRRSPRFSESVLVHNTLLSAGQQRKNEVGGIPSSFIVPEAFLIKDVEMESTRKPLTSLLPLIENPVGNSAQTEKTLKVEDEK